MSSTPRQLFWQGYRAAMPLMAGVAPFGLVFGALAVAAGMSVWQALGMSILVLAGASQFIAAELIRDHTPVLLIVFTTFIVNLRHFLYSASLTDYLKPLSRGWRAVIAYVMVDEVYAVSYLRKQAGDLEPQGFRWFFVGAGICLITLWWATTVLGALVGDTLSADVQDALNFSLALIFTAIVVPSLKNRPLVGAALSAGIAGILLAPLPNRLGLIVAALIGIGVGLWLEGRKA